MSFPSYRSPVPTIVCCRSQVQHRKSTSLFPCPVPSTNRQKGSGTEDLEGVTSTPATSTLVVLSHSSLGYSSFYQILMPTVSKIFCTVYPEEKKKKTSLQCIGHNFCGDLGPMLILNVWHFFIQSSGLGSTQIQN